jgi:hypothetical protein
VLEFFILEFCWWNFSCGSTRRILSVMTAKVEQASAGSASSPERGPAGSVQRIGQGRLIILFALAFEFLLGFPEARDARCDFGAVARESFFLLRHRPSVSCLIRAPPSLARANGARMRKRGCSIVIARPMRSEGGG